MAFSLIQDVAFVRDVLLNSGVHERLPNAYYARIYRCIASEDGQVRFVMFSEKAIEQGQDEVATHWSVKEHTLLFTDGKLTEAGRRFLAGKKDLLPPK
jgi:hypothetical protein